MVILRPHRMCLWTPRICRGAAMEMRDVHRQPRVRLLGVVRWMEEIMTQDREGDMSTETTLSEQCFSCPCNTCGYGFDDNVEHHGKDVAMPGPVVEKHRYKHPFTCEFAQSVHEDTLNDLITELGYCRACKPMGDEGPHFRHDGGPCSYHPGDCSEVGHTHQFCPCGSDVAQRDQLLYAAKDALESLKRIPDGDGAKCPQCIMQLEKAIANAEGD